MLLVTILVSKVQDYETNLTAKTHINFYFCTVKNKFKK